jgi:hypothetical protein
MGDPARFLVSLLLFSECRADRSVGVRIIQAAVQAGGGCWQLAAGDVLQYADGSARQALRFTLAFFIIRTHSCIGAGFVHY